MVKIIIQGQPLRLTPPGSPYIPWHLKILCMQGACLRKSQINYQNAMIYQGFRRCPGCCLWGKCTKTHAYHTKGDRQHVRLDCKPIVTPSSVVCNSKTVPKNHQKVKKIISRKLLLFLLHRSSLPVEPHQCGSAFCNQRALWRCHGDICISKRSPHVEYLRFA